MSATGAGYDLSPTTFSPDGRVFQVEYAGKAVEKSGTAIGVKCLDGVVVGGEDHFLQDAGQELEPAHAGRRQTLRHGDEWAGGRRAAAGEQGPRGVDSYKSFYGTPIPGQVLADRIAGHVHMHTLYWYLRPFGASVLIASYDEQPGLWMVEPSGICYKYFGCAIGKGRAGAKTELEKIKFDQIKCKDAVFEVARIIYLLHDEVKDKPFELELSWVCDDSKREHVLVPDQLRDEAIARGQALKKKNEQESDDEMDTKPEKRGQSGAPAAGSGSAMTDTAKPEPKKAS